MTIAPTIQQTRIFDEVPTLEKDCAVIARAGSGKTWTATKTAKMTDGNVIMLAFDREAAMDLGNKYGNRKRCRTFHSYGFQGIQEAISWAVKDVDGLKVKRYLHEECSDLERHHYVIKRAISYAKNTLDNPRRTLERELAADIDDDDELAEILDECVEAVREQLSQSLDRPDVVDFDDMIFLPATHPTIRPPNCDVLFIDEAQDVNRCQAEFASRMKCRRVWIGDPYQAIYGWRGASSRFLETVAQGHSYHLTNTFRCGKEIVRFCRRMVPDFECLPGQHEGRVNTVSEMTDVKAGDFVLARRNADLVPIALDLARDNKQCVIIGKGLGGACKKLLRKIGADNIKDLRSGLYDYIEDVRERDLDDSIKASMIEIAQIIDYAAGAVGVIGEIMPLLSYMFAPKVEGDVIRLSTVHKAKGMEADNVFVLANQLTEKTDEERNIKYVACSRARHTLNLYYHSDDS